MAVPEREAGRRSQSRLRARVLFTARLLAGGIIVYWLAKSGRFEVEAYEALLEGGNAWFLLGLFAGLIIIIVLPIYRWWLLMRASGVPIGLGEAARVTLMGCFANLFVPGGLGIDGVRLVYCRRHFPGKMAVSFSSVLVDRLLGLQALMILSAFFGSLLVLQVNSEETRSLLLMAMGVGALILAALAVATGFVRVPRIGLLTRVGAIMRVLRALEAFRHRRRVLVAGLLISLVSHLGTGVASAFALLSLGQEVALLGVFTVTPLITMAKLVPITPLGLGISDGVAAWLYPMVGLSRGAEVQMLLRGVLSVIFVASGVAYFKQRAELREDPEMELREKSALPGGNA